MTSDANEAGTRSADLAQIMRMIPHRYPFLLVDRVVDIRANENAVGIKNVTINEPFFQGHFPTEPVMPGVLIVEALAQTAGVLVVDSLGMIDEELLVYFMTIDNCRFRAKVVPGDVLQLHVQVTRSRGKVYKFAGQAKVNGKLAAEAEFSAMIIDKDDQRRGG
ncbi:MAG: 3-hydroxyacyl-ACP dehydratase FabZ [Paracoccaceae bacterium]|nr:3-hydroxyacyl-ACP dehydratase FabZ [Paracoccaceae bacterium]